MKKLIILFTLFGINLSFAQELDTTLTLTDMEIPISPAFILMDQAPSSIERPNNPRAFGISILNSFTESNGLPKNYAVDFTPFWFFKHKKMSVLKYAGYNDKKQRPFASLKMVSLSMAYINQTDSISISPINNISFGVRTNLLKIRSKENLKAIAIANSNAVNHLVLIDSIVVARIGGDDFDDREGYRQKQRILKQFLQDSLNLNNKIAEALLQKPIFAVDFAIAYNTFFTNNDISTQHFGRFGTWLTLNYAQKLNEDNTNYLNVYAIGRYIQDGASRDSLGVYTLQTFYDFGGKIEIELRKFSLGFEYIYRSNNSIDTYRATGQLKYQISKNLFITGAFGKNFGTTNNLVSMLGINWGFLTGNEKATIK